MAGQRVLIVEEEAASSGFPGLREPFFLAGARGGGILEHGLRELTLSLIDRRRIEDEELSYQLVDDNLRADVGSAEVSAEELVAWGVCKPDIAHALVRGLVEASEAERKAMLANPLVRIGRRKGRGRIGGEGSHRRGLPAEAANAEAQVARLLQAQLRALSNLGTSAPGPEAQARLLGSALKGGAGFPGGPPWLHEILRRRVESVFGEFRTLSRDFRLVSVMNQPGICVQGSSEIWVGRMLIIAAPTSALARRLGPENTPGFLDPKRKGRRRINVHLRVRRRVLPEGMAKRVVLLEPTNRPGPIATLNLFARDDDQKWVDLVVRGMEIEGIDNEEQEQQLVDRALALMPFHGEQVERIPVKIPRWDDDHWLEDPQGSACWPGEMDLRLSAKLPVFQLDRAWVAGLGLEGDLLLGLRAGEQLHKALA